MDQLAVRAPEAHAHLRELPPNLQESIGDSVLKLSHVDLMTQTEHPFGGIAYEPIASESYTPEHLEHHDRVGSLMTGASRLIKEASEELTKHKPVEEIYSSLVIEQAASIGVERAKKLHEAGDIDASTQEIKNILTLHLLDPNQHKVSRDNVRELLSNDLGSELVEAIRDLDGVLSLAGSRGGGAMLGNTLQESRELIIVATGTDFDDRMRNPQPIQVDRLSPADQEYLDRQMQKLTFADFATLASQQDKQGKSEEAKQLSTKSLELLKKTDREHPIDAKDIVLALTSAEKIFSEAGGEGEPLGTTLAVLRARRQPKSQYRSNSTVTNSLDIALVELARDEDNVELVRGLLSSTPIEIRHEGAVSGGTNLDNRFSHVRPIMSPEEAAVVHSRIEKIHAEKMLEFRTQLSERGANEETINRILLSGLDPDSALGIPKEFWENYNNQTFGRNGSERINTQLVSLIERSTIPDLSVSAKLAETVLANDAMSDRIIEPLMLKITAIPEAAMDSEFITDFIATFSLVEVFRTEQREKNPHKQQIDSAIIMHGLVRFARPSEALELSKRLYGDAALEKLYIVEKMMTRYYGQEQKELLEIGPQALEMIDIITQVSTNPNALFNDNELIARMFTKLTTEECREFLQAIEASPQLSRAQEIFQSSEIVRAALLNIDSSPIENVRNLEKVLSTEGLQAGIELLGQPIAQRAVLNDILNKYRTDQLYIETVVEALQSDNLRLLLETYPSDIAALIGSISKNSYSSNFINEISQVVLSERFVELHRFVGPEHSDDLFRRVVLSQWPQIEAESIIQVYELSDFIQERIPNIDYISHSTEWAYVLSSIPEGNEGERIKSQILKRLQLEVNEPPEQAIRIFTEIIPDVNFETALIEQGWELLNMLYVAENLRGFPSSNPAKLKNILITSELQEIYQKLFEFKTNNDFASATDLMQSYGFSQQSEPARPLTELVGSLKEGVANYGDQVKKSRDWIRDYSGQDIRAVKLIEAWDSRSLALANGAKDNPTDILNFVAENGVSVYYQQLLDTIGTTVSEEELQASQPLIQAIGSRYSPQVTFRALETRAQFIRDQGAYPRKIINQTKEDVTVLGRTYSTEIFGSDDPRGFTIGYDTGCCMTLGGASETCIWAGFEDPRYMFFGVYENGRLRAQSVMYVAEGRQGKILVVDNIEANEGTDLETVSDVYRLALSSAIEQQGITDITAIHVGTGYTAPEAIERLPIAEEAPGTPRTSVYTDARSQRVLWQRDAVA